MDAVSAGFYTGGSFRFPDANEHQLLEEEQRQHRDAKNRRGGRGQQCYEEKKRDGDKGREREKTGSREEASEPPAR